MIDHQSLDELNNIQGTFVERSETFTQLTDTWIFWPLSKCTGKGGSVEKKTSLRY